MTQAKDSMQVFYDKDCAPQLLTDKQIAIVGYGSQGHAHALNLRDSGAKHICIGLREDSASRAKAEQDGFEVASVAEAAARADMLMLLAPDEKQQKIYADAIAKPLRRGAALLFAHGLAIHFRLIRPREDLDVMMVAPKGPGHTVRGEYLQGRGVPCLMAVAQDASGEAQDLALAWAAGLGGGRAGILATSFRDECETDLFGEQAVLCGGLVHLIRAGYETLVDAGYPPEMAYFECLHEVKLIVDLMYEGGIANMNYSISNTAEYGEYVSGPRVVTSETRAEMKRILADIQSGDFVKRWMNENSNDVEQRHFRQLRKEAGDHPIEETGRRLRGMMPWLADQKLVDRKKN